MSLNIKISNFEGPFDLLLHLIKKNEMDIRNIRIFEITNQYLDILKEMKEMDLDITSEFIVIAATLIEIKSKLLLPKPKVEEEEEDEEDAAKILVEKLLQYKKFKAVAEHFHELDLNSGVTFSKKPEIIEETKKPKDEDILKNITMLDLYNLYNELINNYFNKRNSEATIDDKIKADVYKIEDKMDEVTDLIHNKRKMKFSEIIHSATGKLEVIVTFLALLELIKMKTLKVVQDGNFQDIFIERIDSDEKKEG